MAPSGPQNRDHSTFETTPPHAARRGFQNSEGEGTQFRRVRRVR